MKYLLILLMIIVANYSVAQNTYSILYNRHIETGISFDMQKINFDLESRLVFNDTLSFYYMIPRYSKDKNRQVTVLGDKLVHQALMYNLKADELYEEMLLLKKQGYYYKDSLIINNWKFSNETKDILGYKCNVAYSVGEANDTTVVWYTNKLGAFFGPFRYFGLPGVGLEIQDQKFNLHLVATKVELTSQQLVLPQYGERISKEDLCKKLKKINYVAH